MQISPHAKIIHKSNDNQSHIFCFQVCQWGSKAQFCDPKMSTKSTRAHPADSVPSPKLPKDTPAARSQHSGRVGGRSYARLKAEIALHNIPTTTRHDTQPQSHIFKFFVARLRHVRASILRALRTVLLIHIQKYADSLGPKLMLTYPHGSTSILPSKIALPRPTALRIASATFELVCPHIFLYFSCFNTLKLMQIFVPTLQGAFQDFETASKIEN